MMVCSVPPGKEGTHFLRTAARPRWSSHECHIALTQPAAS